MWTRAFVDQAASDMDVYEFIRNSDQIAPCHELHYLQMATEKLGKAVLLINTQTPQSIVKSHKAFVKLLRIVDRNPRLRDLLGMNNRQLKMYLKKLSPLAYDIQKLAPALAQGGPNSEYPWQNPGGTIEHPAGHTFYIYGQLRNNEGRNLIKLIRLLIDRFDECFN